MLRKSGITSSLLLGLILLSAFISSIMTNIWTHVNSGIAEFISNNWLMIIFKIHSRILPSEPNPLIGIKLYDILILLLFIITCLSLFKKSQKKSNIWIIVAASLMLLGILIYLITQLAGRSSFMASGIIISVLLFSRAFQNKIIGALGLLANILLLIGDFTVGSHLKIIPILFCIGYLLVIIWMFFLTRIITGTVNNTTNT